MFDLKNFIVKNIVNGVKNGTFTKEYANIMAVNYLVKGVLTEENVIDIDSQISEWEAAQNAETEAEAPADDVITEPETYDEPEATEPGETATAE